MAHPTTNTKVYPTKRLKISIIAVNLEEKKERKNRKKKESVTDGTIYKMVSYKYCQ